MGWRELTRSTSYSRKCVVQVPRTINLNALPAHKLSPVVFPPSFDPASKSHFLQFLQAFYFRKKDQAEDALTAGLDQATANSKEALWFLIAKALLALDRGYIQSPPEIDSLLDEAENGTDFPKDELRILWALRGLNRVHELSICGREAKSLDAEQEKYKLRFKDYLARMRDIYFDFSRPDATLTEVQAFFRIAYHRYIVREFPQSVRRHALAQELATNEPKEYLRFCDDLLHQGRIDLFLYNIRFRGRSVAGLGPKPFQDRLQQCIGLAKSKQHVALCRYLLIRNTDHVFEDPRDGPDRRFPEYLAISPLFEATGDLVDSSSCRLLALQSRPVSEHLTIATELREQFERSGYPGLALDCVIETEIPLCLSSEIAKQVGLTDKLVTRLWAAAKLEEQLVGPRNCHIRVYDNLIYWMSEAKNVYTLAILLEFTEILWSRSEPAQEQAITLSDRVSSGYDLITKTLYGRFPCLRLVELCYDSAWRFLSYARLWKDDNILSTAMSRMLYWQVAQASFSQTNRELVPKLAEVEELAQLAIEKDRDEVRYPEMIEKCCIIARAAMLHPARARTIDDVEHYRLARSIERRGGPQTMQMLDEVAKDFELADHGRRDKPLSVEARARGQSKNDYAAWKERTKEDERFQAFVTELRVILDSKDAQADRESESRL